MDTKKLMGLVVTVVAFSLQAKTVYVNCNFDDYTGHDGSTPEKAVKTLMEGVNSAGGGDTVEVAEGVYDEGDANPSGWWGKSRVHINCKNIHLKASGRRDYTIIEGAHDPDTGGVGPKAIRCITVQDVYPGDGKGSASVIEGFTLRNGATSARGDEPGWGGALLSMSFDSKAIYPCLVDCTISNCTAYCAAVSRGGRFVRCKVYENVIQTASTRSDLAYYSDFVNSLICNNQVAGSSGCPTCVNYNLNFVNCTLLDNAFKIYPSDTAFANCLFSSSPVSTAAGTFKDNFTEDLSNPVLWHAGLPGDARICEGRVTALQVGAAENLDGLSLQPGVDAYVDYYGQQIPASGAVCAGCSQGIGPGSVPPIWYCAPDGDDAASGLSADSPKTLQGALSVARAGDKVMALPGTYDSGSMIQSGTGYALRSRAVVPSGVMLESVEGRDKTLILGEEGQEDEGGAGQKLGTGAMRCVFLSGTAQVKGFTLRDGHTFNSVPGGGDAFSSLETTGGGVNGSSRYSGIVEDCVVENCSSFRGGGAYGVSVRDCVFRNNLGRYIGGATSDCKCYGSLAYGNTVDDSLYGGEYSKGFAWSSWIEGCTTLDGATMNGSSCVLRNTLVLGYYDCSQPAAENVSNCAFNRWKAASWTQSWEDGLVNSVIVEPVHLTLDSNYAPVIGSNVCVDAGNAAISTVIGDRDVQGNARISNGRLDIGAVEADWRGRYAKDLSKMGFATVVEASSGVVESDSQTVLLPDAAKLVLKIDPPANELEFVLNVKVPVEGLLSVSIDGVEKSYSGDSAVLIPPAAQNVVLSYAGDGATELCGMRKNGGLVIILK